MEPYRRTDLVALFPFDENLPLYMPLWAEFFQSEHIVHEHPVTFKDAVLAKGNPARAMMSTMLGDPFFDEDALDRLVARHAQAYRELDAREKEGEIVQHYPVQSVPLTDYEVQSDPIVLPSKCSYEGVYSIRATEQENERFSLISCQVESAVRRLDGRILVFAHPMRVYNTGFPLEKRLGTVARDAPMILYI